MSLPSTIRALMLASLGAVPPVLAAPLCPAAEAAIDATAARTLAQGSPGMLVGVYERGEPRFLRAYGLADLETGTAMRTTSVFRIASVTKTFTAAAVLALAEDGRLRLDDPLSAYLPGFPNGAAITIEQLLVQTAGLPDYAGLAAEQGTQALARTPEAMAAWVAELASTPLAPPGSAWAYSNSHYALLGRVLEIASGQSLAEVFNEKLFAPAGLRHTAFDDPADVVPGRVRGYRRHGGEAAGFANADAIHFSLPGAAGGLRSTLDDLARWNAALFDGRIVSDASLARMLAPGRLADGRRTGEGMPEAWRTGLGADYAMGLFRDEKPGHLRLWHSGDLPGFSTWVAHYPAHATTIVLAINSESADLDRAAVEAAVFGDCRAD